MKAYGIPRTMAIEYADRSDCALYGLKGYRTYQKHSSRRIWKKKERLAAKKGIQKELTQLWIDADADEFEASNPYDYDTPYGDYDDWNDDIYADMYEWVDFPRYTAKEFEDDELLGYRDEDWEEGDMERDYQIF